ncbi:MAG: hypothetical protein ABH869_03615 [Candidatus Omnitrophota bacterium]
MSIDELSRKEDLLQRCTARGFSKNEAEQGVESLMLKRFLLSQKTTGKIRPSNEILSKRGKEAKARKDAVRRTHILQQVLFYNQWFVNEECWKLKKKYDWLEHVELERLKSSAHEVVLAKGDEPATNWFFIMRRNIYSKFRQEYGPGTNRGFKITKEDRSSMDHIRRVMGMSEVSLGNYDLDMLLIDLQNYYPNEQGGWERKRIVRLLDQMQPDVSYEEYHSDAANGSNGSKRNGKANSVIKKNSVEFGVTDDSSNSYWLYKFLKTLSVEEEYVIRALSRMDEDSDRDARTPKQVAAMLGVSDKRVREIQKNFAELGKEARDWESLTAKGTLKPRRIPLKELNLKDREKAENFLKDKRFNLDYSGFSTLINIPILMLRYRAVILNLHGIRIEKYPLLLAADLTEVRFAAKQLSIEEFQQWLQNFKCVTDNQIAREFEPAYLDSLFLDKKSLAYERLARINPEILHQRIEKCKKLGLDYLSFLGVLEFDPGTINGILCDLEKIGIIEYNIALPIAIELINPGFIRDVTKDIIKRIPVYKRRDLILKNLINCYPGNSAESELTRSGAKKYLQKFLGLKGKFYSCPEIIEEESDYKEHPHKVKNMVYRRCHKFLKFLSRDKESGIFSELCRYLGSVPFYFEVHEFNKIKWKLRFEYEDNPEEFEGKIKAIVKYFNAYIRNDAKEEVLKDFFSNKPENYDIREISKRHNLNYLSSIRYVTRVAHLLGQASQIRDFFETQRVRLKFDVSKKRQTKEFLVRLFKENRFSFLIRGIKELHLCSSEKMELFELLLTEHAKNEAQVVKLHKELQQSTMNMQIMDDLYRKAVKTKETTITKFMLEKQLREALQLAMWTPYFMEYYLESQKLRKTKKDHKQEKQTERQNKNMVLIRKLLYYMWHKDEGTRQELLKEIELYPKYCSEHVEKFYRVDEDRSWLKELAQGKKLKELAENFDVSANTASERIDGLIKRIGQSCKIEEWTENYGNVERVKRIEVKKKDIFLFQLILCVMDKEKRERIRDKLIFYIPDTIESISRMKFYLKNFDFLSQNKAFVRSGQKLRNESLQGLCCCLTAVPEIRKELIILKKQRSRNCFESTVFDRNKTFGILSALESNEIKQLIKNYKNIVLNLGYVYPQEDFLKERMELSVCNYDECFFEKLFVRNEAITRKKIFTKKKLAEILDILEFSPIVIEKKISQIEDAVEENPKTALKYAVALARYENYGSRGNFSAELRKRILSVIKKLEKEQIKRFFGKEETIKWILRETFKENPKKFNIYLRQYKSLLGAKRKDNRRIAREMRALKLLTKKNQRDEYLSSRSICDQTGLTPKSFPSPILRLFVFISEIRERFEEIEKMRNKLNELPISNLSREDRNLAGWILYDYCQNNPNEVKEWLAMYPALFGVKSACDDNYLVLEKELLSEVANGTPIFMTLKSFARRRLGKDKQQKDKDLRLEDYRMEYNALSRGLNNLFRIPVFRKKFNETESIINQNLSVSDLNIAQRFVRGYLTPEFISQSKFDKIKEQYRMLPGCVNRPEASVENQKLVLDFIREGKFFGKAASKKTEHGFTVEAYMNATKDLLTRPDLRKKINELLIKRTRRICLSAKEKKELRKKLVILKKNDQIKAIVKDYFKFQTEVLGEFPLLDGKCPVTFRDSDYFILNCLESGMNAKKIGETKEFHKKPGFGKDFVAEHCAKILIILSCHPAFEHSNFSKFEKARQEKNVSQITESFFMNANAGKDDQFDKLISIFSEEVNLFFTRVKEESEAQKSKALATVGGRESKEQNIIIYADDLLESNTFIDIEESIKLLVENSLPDITLKILIYAQKEANADIIESFLKRAEPSLEITRVMQKQLFEKSKSADKSEADELETLIFSAKSRNITDILAVIKGPTLCPEPLAKVSKRFKVPVILVGTEKDAIYSFTQAIAKAMEIIKMQGQNGWVVIMPPTRLISEDIRKQYEEYRASLRLLQAA